MRIVVTSGGSSREVDVTAMEASTIGELLDAVMGDDAPRPDERVTVDGAPVARSTPVGESGVGSGSEVGPGASGDEEPGVCELRILAGRGAGSSVTLPPGRYVIGSGRGADLALRAPGVRVRHAELAVTRSGGAAIGAVGGRRRALLPASIVRIGSVMLSVAVPAGSRPALDTTPGRRGTVSFNRPPRRTADHPRTQIGYPGLPEPPGRRGSFSFAALLVPLLFGIVLAVLIDPRLALFALLGPVMMVGGRIEDWRRARSHAREVSAALEKGAATLGRRLRAAMARELMRRHAEHPSVPELGQWPRFSSRMWERRPHHRDFMQLVGGYGREPWSPPVPDPDDSTPPAFVRVVAAHAMLPTTAIPLDMRPGQVLGIAGGRAAALEAAWGIVIQAVVLHGPADVRVAVATHHPDDWDWAKWLPHVIEGRTERRLLAATADERSRLASTLLDDARPGESTDGARHGDEVPATTLLVVDVDDLGEPTGRGLRQLLGGHGAPVSGLVLATTVERLPSTCTVLLEASSSEPHRPGVLGRAGNAPIALVPAGTDRAVALSVARRLARFDDPECIVEGGELPTALSLVDILGGLPDASDVRRRWADAGWNPPLAATIGMTGAGPMTLDLVVDGPHGLVAGTTGAGKSELLRTLVVAMALAVDPDHLTFVLIDYKGGSAFDACAGLPHTVGMVTDLDDDLAERALRCLEAELRHREQRLRAVGADDLAAYLAMRTGEPLPRMVIVIDEFAALAQELPDFMDALVDIAARGRSLGVHLVLATQRPAGVVRDNVRANTNLRIALRVQDRSDSMDVLSDPRAAAIGRDRPGRGFARLGPGELVPFQTALVTATTADSPSPCTGITDFVFAMEQPSPAIRSASPGESDRADLDRLVAAVSAAASEAGFAPPRRPWPDPLPEMLARSELDVHDPPGPWAVPIGMVDEPDLQRSRTMWWDASSGSLALYGIRGAGTTTALATITVGLAERHRPENLHIYIFDCDAGDLTPLADLPHVGAVVAAGERERQMRLLRHLSAELDRRKAARAAERHSGPVGDALPRIVVIVDDFAGFSAAYDASVDAPWRDAMHRIVAEGPAVEVVGVVTGARQSAIPLTLAGSIPGKLVFRMADPLAAAALGLRTIPSHLPTGRAIDVASGRTVQLAVPDGGWDAAIGPLAGRTPRGGPMSIGELPVVVKTDEIGHAVQILGDHWFLPVGIGDTDLGVAGLRLASGDHALVAGEPRSGRSSLLGSLAAMVAASGSDVAVTAVAPRPSPLRDAASTGNLVTDIADLDEMVVAISRAGGRHLVLLDDVDAWDAPAALCRLVDSTPAGIRIVGAGRRDLKSQFNHWARSLCRSRIGLWLKPGPGLDGDLWSTPMPRRIPAGMPPGRGYLVSEGTVELVQTATV